MTKCSTPSAIAESNVIHSINLKLRLETKTSICNTIIHNTSK